MNSISLASSIAMAVGLAAALPQIGRMLNSRSAAGQSQTGWAMGLLTNGCMGYVNLVGFDAPWLALSNALSAVLCVAAIGLIARFGDAAHGEPAELVAGRDVRISAPPAHALADLSTQEFVVLRTAIDAIDAQRAARARGDQEAALQPA